MLAVSAAPQNSVQAQKHIMPSGVQLPFGDVRVLYIQVRTYLRVIQWVATITKAHALYMLCMYVCMYVCMYRRHGSDVYFGMSPIPNGSSYLRY